VPPLALVRLAARKPARAPAFALAVLVEFLQRQADMSSAWLISLRARRVRYSKSRPSRPRKRRCPPGPCSISSWSHHAASVCRCSCAVDEKGDCLACGRERETTVCLLVLQSTSFLRARTPSLRHFFIDESNRTFHSFQTFRMMIYLRARSHSPRAEQVTVEGSAEAS
jgi:hypothetical protein